MTQYYKLPLTGQEIEEKLLQGQRQVDWEQKDKTEFDYIKNRTHYYESLYPDSIFPVEINPNELEEGEICPIITTNNPATFSSAFKYESMLVLPSLIETYTLDFTVDTQDKSNSGYNFVSKFKLFDDKNYSFISSSGLTIYVVVDTSILSEEYKAMFSDVGVYAQRNGKTLAVRYSLKLVKFSVTLPEQFIPDMFPRLHGEAKVGQVLQVEKIDYFGNPTKWGAIDVSTDEDIINLLTELQIISPISSSTDDVYISNNGDIYTL